MFLGLHRGALSSTHVGNGVGSGGSSICINTLPPHEQTPSAMVAKDSDKTPPLALCPRCHLAINPRECYTVKFFMPAHFPPPPPSKTSADRTTDWDHDGEGKPAPSSPPTQPESDDPPSSPLSPGQFHDVASSPPSSPTRVSSPTISTDGKGRRLSAASTDYGFDDFVLNSQLDADLRRADGPYEPPSPPTSSPSTESSLVPSMLGELASPLVGRRWVVFRGRVPGVYTSS